MVKGRFQRSDDQRQRSIRKPPSLFHGSGLMVSLMQLNRPFSEITAGDGTEAILGHVDTDAVCHAARFVHAPSLRMRARSAHATVRAFGQSYASRALLTRGLSGPEEARAGLSPQPRRLRAGWQLRDTRGGGSRALWLDERSAVDVWGKVRRPTRSIARGCSFCAAICASAGL